MAVLRGSEGRRCLAEWEPVVPGWEETYGSGAQCPLEAFSLLNSNLAHVHSQFVPAQKIADEQQL